MHLSLSAKLGRLPIAFSAPVRDYFSRLDAAGLRVGKYDLANARLIDRLVANGGNFWPDSGAFNCMAGYAYPGNGEDLIPLHPNHDAGTLNNFVTDDWNAVTGLLGDGSTKYVGSNRTDADDGQNDASFGCFQSTAGAGALMGSGAGVAGKLITNFSGGYVIRCNDTSFIIHAKVALDGQLVAATRNSSTAYDYRIGGITSTQSQNSLAIGSNEIRVFHVIGITYSDARIPFYHIGPNLNGTGELAELETILTDWQTDLANA